MWSKKGKYTMACINLCLLFVVQNTCIARSQNSNVTLTLIVSVSKISLCMLSYRVVLIVFVGFLDYYVGT